MISYNDKFKWYRVDGLPACVVEVALVEYKHEWRKGVRIGSAPYIWGWMKRNNGSEDPDAQVYRALREYYCKEETIEVLKRAKIFNWKRFSA
jgi:hypothetical protein